MELFPIFSTVIAKFKLKQNLNNLEKFCVSLKDKQGRKLSNLSGYQSKNIDLKNKIIKIFVNEIQQKINEYKKIYSIDLNLNILNLWININKYKDANASHTHPGSYISGVFYIKAPKNCGNIVFKNSNQIENFIQENIFSSFTNVNSSLYHVSPEENVLYLFPSWLEHYVEPNLSKKNRISISFNFKK